MEIRRPLTSTITKRILDLLFSILLVLLFSPILVLVAVVIIIDSGFPILYHQIRVGQDGKYFEMHKFRSMDNKSEGKQNASKPGQNIGIKTYNDLRNSRDASRITTAGALLRKYSLDELPQFINVLKNEMSIVGPRPYLPDEVDINDIKMRTILSVKPGITGLWQVTGRNQLSFEKRQQLDQNYATEQSFRMDCIIFSKTIWTVLSGTGR